MEFNGRYYYSRHQQLKNGFKKFTITDYKISIVNSFFELSYRIYSQVVSDNNLSDSQFKKSSAYSPKTSDNYKNNIHIIIKNLNELSNQYISTKLDLIIESVKIFLLKIDSYNSLYDLINSYKRVLLQINEFTGFIMNKSSNYVKLDTNTGKIKFNLNTNCTENIQLDGSGFLNLISCLFENQRHEQRLPFFDEYVSLQMAFYIISKQGFINSDIVPWGNSGFREIQTQASITDPGMGHIVGTTENLGNLNGTNVHIEFLERGKQNNREKVEPYRLPDLRKIAEVKLLTGRDTSVSSYVGRPMFEDSFDNSFIKTVHTTISVCSSIFMNGLSECKVAIERMTTTQAIKFMKAVSSNVIRDRSTQILAAAFCINYPIIDNRPNVLEHHGGKPIKVYKRMDLAKLGIELAKDGGFEKVTFDGTANEYPSLPIMEQLGFKNALELVHLAHEKGLITYFSAGFRFKHLHDIVLNGTDGIGLGGAQILRYMDFSNGYQGPFKKENIEKILEINKKASNTLLGKGSLLLCRLDEMFYEKSISEKENIDRDVLFNALQHQDEKLVKKIIENNNSIMAMAPDVDNPEICKAKRIIKNKDNCLLFKDKDNNEKNIIVQKLNGYIKNKDFIGIMYELNEIK